MGIAVQLSLKLCASEHILFGKAHGVHVGLPVQVRLDIVQHGLDLVVQGMACVDL